MYKRGEIKHVTLEEYIERAISKGS